MMMDRRSFLALLAAVPLAAVVPPLDPGRPIPIWSSLTRMPANQDGTVYQVALMNPAWGPIILRGAVFFTQQQLESLESQAGPVDLLRLKFQNTRDSLLTYVSEHLTDTAAGRAQIHALLDPYCAGVLA